MDPSEIIKAAPEIAEGLTAVGAAIPFTSIVKKMLGPAADELAEMWRDKIRLYRYGNQMRCIEKAEKMAKDAGFTPKAVPPKLLFPLLEGASFEEDDTIHDMWAALMVNASNPHHQPMLRLGFLDLVKRISPDSALLMNSIWQRITTGVMEDEVKGIMSNPLNIIRVGEWTEVLRMYTELPLSTLGNDHKMLALSKPDRVRVILRDLRYFWLCIDELVREDLLVRRVRVTEDEVEEVDLTLYGFEFMTACTPPKPKS